LVICEFVLCRIYCLVMMKTPSEIRAMVDRVTSYPVNERERIYKKYFTRPPETARFLCQEYGLDQKRVLDVACHYGYYLVHFGAGSVGLDGSPQYLQYAREMGLTVQQINLEHPFPTFDQPFDALFFSGTLEEILSPHVALMRFRALLKPDGLLCLRVPTVPPIWFDRLIRLRRQPGYDAEAHLYFFTPRLLEMVVKRAGYEIVQTVSTGFWMNKFLRPFHRVLLPLTPATTIIARPRPGFKYPPIRAMRFLPDWAGDLAPYHQG
jgi:SAM-dependent methyltransferase